MVKLEASGLGNIILIAKNQEVFIITKTMDMNKKSDIGSKNVTITRLRKYLYPTDRVASSVTGQGQGGDTASSRAREIPRRGALVYATTSATKWKGMKRRGAALGVPYFVARGGKKRPPLSALGQSRGNSSTRVGKCPGVGLDDRVA